MNENNKSYDSKSIASLVLGIVSCAFIFFGYGALIGCICGIIGLILGIGVRKENPEDNMALVGVIFSAIGVAFCALVFLSCVACVGCVATGVALS